MIYTFYDLKKWPKNFLDLCLDSGTELFGSLHQIHYIYGIEIKR